MRTSLVVFFFLSVLPLRADDVNAASTSAAHVQAAIDSAIDGDRVIVPAGTSTWDVEVDVPTGKQIDIIGNGVGSTIIIRGAGIGSTSPTLDYHVSPGEGTAELSGIEFRNNSGTDSSEGIVRLSGAAGVHYDEVLFWVHDCEFDKDVTGRTIKINGIYGLINDVVFNTTITVGQVIGYFANSNRATDITWHTPQPYGTQNYLVIEDCTFNSVQDADGAIDAYDGTKYVMRHNTILNTNIGHHGADSGQRSCRQFEIYNNAFTYDYTLNQSFGVKVRGGTGVFFNNTFTTSNAFKFSSMVMISYNAADGVYSRAVWGLMNGTNDADGNFGTVGYDAAYPCIDQPGRGSFPPAQTWDGTAPAPDNWEGSTQGDESGGPYQVLEPIYAWNNDFYGDTSPLLSVGQPDETENLVKEGTDYHDNTVKPGYVQLDYPHPLRGAVTSGTLTTTTLTVGP